jgi:hypothetical protein
MSIKVEDQKPVNFEGIERAWPPPIEALIVLVCALAETFMLWWRQYVRPERPEGADEQH